jgi:hypothetical protein
MARSGDAVACVPVVWFVGPVGWCERPTFGQRFSWLGGGCVPLGGDRFRASAGGRCERPQTRERCDELSGPRPVGLDTQVGLAGVEGEAGGDVEQPIAKAFGFGEGEIAGEQQLLGPRG